MIDYIKISSEIVWNLFKQNIVRFGSLRNVVVKATLTTLKVKLSVSAVNIALRASTNKSWL